MMKMLETHSMSHLHKVSTLLAQKVYKGIQKVYSPKGIQKVYTRVDAGS